MKLIFLGLFLCFTHVRVLISLIEFDCLKYTAYYRYEHQDLLMGKKQLIEIGEGL